MAIREYCRESGQPQPEGPGEVTRCILDSLAFAFRQTLDQLSGLLRKQFDVLHIVGGGSLNSLLCQSTANATSTLVRVGPVEATVAGNILTQALARGYLSSPREVRTVIQRSTKLVKYAPQGAERWEDRYVRYLQLTDPAKRPEVACRH